MTFEVNDLERLQSEFALKSSLNFSDTYIPGVRLFYAKESVALNPMLYPAGIAILCQGEKRGIFGDRTFTYNQDNFLIVSVSTPISCQTIANANKPVFGLFIDAEISSLRSIAREMESSYLNRDAHSLGVEPVKMKAEMKEVVTRLVKIMPSQLESRVLGEGIKKEILFRALESEHGHALYSLIQENSSQSRISKVIDYIKRNYREKMTVESLVTR